MADDHTESELIDIVDMDDSVVADNNDDLYCMPQQSTAFDKDLNYLIIHYLSQVQYSYLQPIVNELYVQLCENNSMESQLQLFDCSKDTVKPYTYQQLQHKYNSLPNNTLSLLLQQLIRYHNVVHNDGVTNQLNTDRLLNSNTTLLLPQFRPHTIIDTTLHLHTYNIHRYNRLQRNTHYNHRLLQSSRVTTNGYRHMRRLFITNGHLGDSYTICCDRSGTRVFTGSDDYTIKMWNITNGQLLFTFRGHNTEVSDICVSPDNRYIASSSITHCINNSQRTESIIRVWNMLGEPIATINAHIHDVFRVVFSNKWCDGHKLLYSGSADGKFKIWNCELFGINIDYQPVTTYTCTAINDISQPVEINWFTIHHNGNEAAFGNNDHNVRIYNIIHQKEIAILSGHLGTDCLHVEYSSDGNRLLVVTSINTGSEVCVWERRVRQIRQHYHLNDIQQQSIDATESPTDDTAQYNAEYCPICNENELDIEYTMVARHYINNTTTTQNKSDSRAEWSVCGTRIYISTPSHNLVVCDVPALLGNLPPRESYINKNINTNSIINRPNTRSSHITLPNSTVEPLNELIIFNTIHTAEIAHIVPHPYNSYIVATAGLDSKLVIYDCLNGYILKQFELDDQLQYNYMIWSNDGTKLLATTDKGYLCIYGYGSRANYYNTYSEQFFHKDYKELSYGTDYTVIDTESNLLPHLAPGNRLLVDRDDIIYEKQPELSPLTLLHNPLDECIKVNHIPQNINTSDDRDQQVQQYIQRKNAQFQVDCNTVKQLAQSRYESRIRRKYDIHRLYCDSDSDDDSNSVKLMKTGLDRVQFTNNCDTNIHRINKQSELIRQYKTDHSINSTPIRSTQSTGTAPQPQQRRERRNHVTVVDAPADIIDVAEPVDNNDMDSDYENNVHNRSTSNISNDIDSESALSYSEHSDNSSGDLALDEIASNENSETYDGQSALSFRPVAASRRRRRNDSDSDVNGSSSASSDAESDDEYRMTSVRRIHRQRQHRQSRTARRTSRQTQQRRRRIINDDSVDTHVTDDNQSIQQSQSIELTDEQIKLAEQKRSGKQWLERYEPIYGIYTPQLGDQVIYFKQGHQLMIDSILQSYSHTILIDTPVRDELCDMMECTIIDIEYLQLIKPVILDRFGKPTGGTRKTNGTTLDTRLDMPPTYCRLTLQMNEKSYTEYCHKNNYILPIQSESKHNTTTDHNSTNNTNSTMIYEIQPHHTDNTLIDGDVPNIRLKRTATSNHNDNTPSVTINNNKIKMRLKNGTVKHINDNDKSSSSATTSTTGAPFIPSRIIPLDYYDSSSPDCLVLQSRYHHSLSHEWLPTQQFQMWYPDEEKWYIGTIEKNLYLEAQEKLQQSLTQRTTRRLATIQSTNDTSDINTTTPWNCLLVQWINDNTVQSNNNNNKPHKKKKKKKRNKSLNLLLPDHQYVSPWEIELVDANRMNGTDAVDMKQLYDTTVIDDKNKNMNEFDEMKHDNLDIDINDNHNEHNYTKQADDINTVSTDTDDHEFPYKLPADCIIEPLPFINNHNNNGSSPSATSLIQSRYMYNKYATLIDISELLPRTTIEQLLDIIKPYFTSQWELFIASVDESLYADYPYYVPYSVSLDFICDRLTCGYYRHVTHVLHDIHSLYNAARIYNKSDSDPAVAAHELTHLIHITILEQFGDQIPDWFKIPTTQLA